MPQTEYDTFFPFLRVRDINFDVSNATIKEQLRTPDGEITLLKEKTRA